MGCLSSVTEQHPSNLLLHVPTQRRDAAKPCCPHCGGPYGGTGNPGRLQRLGGRESDPRGLHVAPSRARRPDTAFLSELRIARGSAHHS